MNVALGLITDSSSRFLVTKRPWEVDQGGLWEFPGGKLLPQESSEQALIRELREELGIEISQWRHVGETVHEYPKHCIHFSVFWVTHFIGQPSCMSGQLDMQWMSSFELKKANIPKANQAILDLYLSL